MNMAIPRTKKKSSRSGLTHLDADDRPRMVDVSDKAASLREATAEAVVKLPKAVAIALIRVKSLLRSAIFICLRNAGIPTKSPTSNIVASKTPEIPTMALSKARSALSPRPEVSPTGSCREALPV
jgi:cyclic pyranopterin phosphate synthase